MIGGFASTRFQIRNLGYRLSTEYNTLEDFYSFKEGAGLPTSDIAKIEMDMYAQGNYWLPSAFSSDGLERYIYGRTTGDKRYELSNHLGNVLSVVSDKKIPTLFGSSLQYFNPDIKAYNDYYPGGMLMPGRHANTSDYRYGFQNQEMDNEIKGEGNYINFTFRGYDPRANRFFSPDPIEKKYPMLSPFQFASNSLIAKAEIEGLEGGWVIEGQKINFIEGPVANAYNSEEAANNALYRGTAIHNNYTPPGQPTFKQETRSRKEINARKREVESAMMEQKLMAQTFSNPGMQVAHGVYVGIPEGVMEVSGMMIVDKVSDAYRYYRNAKKSKIVFNTLSKVDNLVHPEFINNADDVFDLYRAAETKALSNINNSGKTVLGHAYGADVDYMTLAKQQGASYFDLGEIWGQMVANGQDVWGVNRMFLDKVAAKGDEIILNVTRKNVRKGSYLEREIDYLTSKKDYIWKNNTTLVKNKG